MVISSNTEFFLRLRPSSWTVANRSMSCATIKLNSSNCGPSVGADQSRGFDRRASGGGYEPPSLYGLAPDDYAATSNLS